MSAAVDFAPDVYLPTTTGEQGPHDATILTLARPSAGSVAAPLRLTRRGLVVLVLAVTTLAVALVSVAALSAPSSGAGHRQQPATVTVHEGDTLWAIAARVAPGRDPRAEVAQLQRRNHLAGVALTPGQVLRTR
jgi:nucleoid-associated protein YgaU